MYMVGERHMEAGNQQQMGGGGRKVTGGEEERWQEPRFLRWWEVRKRGQNFKN